MAMSRREINKRSRSNRCKREESFHGFSLPVRYSPVPVHSSIASGRLSVLDYGKRIVRVFDYVDAHIPMLARMYWKRMKGYRAIGYEMESDHQIVVENVDTRSQNG